MKGNSQLLLSPRLYLGDIDGDAVDELIEVDGRHIHVFKANAEHTPVLEHAFAARVKRLVIGDFVSSGREKGKDQIVALLADGSLQAFAISDDRKELWWWFTQPNFIKDTEHFIVGDFDGDGADEIMVYDPASGAIKLHERKGNGVLGEMSGYSLGNLQGHDLKNKLILAGDFGQAAGRTDLLVIDRSSGVVMRFDTADDAGKKSFWWAFTSKPGRFGAGDELIVARCDGEAKDHLVVRERDSGRYRFLRLEYNGGDLLLDASIDAGQLPIKPKAGRIAAARVREAGLRRERGAARDDILHFDDSRCELVRTDARFDAANNRLTYWWAYTSDIVVEPPRTAEKRPWAVILCRFKGLQGDANVEKMFREMFTPGSGGLLDYWHDVTHGALDVDGTRVFGWVELDLLRKDAAIGRAKLIDAAIAAARKAGLDPVTGFHKQIAVFTHDFTKDGAPPGKDWQDPAWAPFWIDGSADGSGRVSAPPHGHNGSFLAHEMGHGMGFDHDLAADLTTHYGDETCIMSAMGVKHFSHPKWKVPFGPAMSLSQLAVKGWTRARRVLRVDKGWTKAGISFELAAMSDPKIAAYLGAILPKDAAGAWDYDLEYVRPIGWNRAQGPLLAIRRRSGGTGALLGKLAVPAAVGGKASWTEPSGKVKFEVEALRADQRVIKVKATKVT